MNGKTILGLVAILGVAKLVFVGHHHRMGPRGRGEWQDRVAELHRELHRRDTEANLDAATTSPAAGA